MHAALGDLDGGAEVNDALMEALADGQEHLVEEDWAPDEAARVASLLDQASLLLLHDALGRAAEAPMTGLDAARAEAAGAWLAGAEPVLAADPALAGLVEAALFGTPDGFALAEARDALAELLETLTES